MIRGKGFPYRVFAPIIEYSGRGAPFIKPIIEVGRIDNRPCFFVTQLQPGGQSLIDCDLARDANFGDPSGNFNDGIFLVNQCPLHLLKFLRAYAAKESDRRVG